MPADLPVFLAGTLLLVALAGVAIAIGRLTARLFLRATGARSDHR